MESSLVTDSAICCPSLCLFAATAPALCLFSVGMTTTSGDPILFVSTGHDLDRGDERFAAVERLADIDVAVYPDPHRKASLWLRQYFKGY